MYPELNNDLVMNIILKSGRCFKSKRIANSDILPKYVQCIYFWDNDKIIGYPMQAVDHIEIIQK